jgi:type I restriction-modification system DNA methylase subunit
VAGASVVVGADAETNGWDDRMSEDFARWAPRAVGPYLYYDLGATTIRQLMAKHIIPKRKYEGLLSKKPDSLLLFQSTAVAVVEHKAPAELAKAPVLAKEVSDKAPAAAALCNLLIITDGQGTTYWVNPHTKNPILDETGKPVRTPVNVKSFENIAELDVLIQKIAGSITKTNDTISGELAIDPTPLAQRLWQTIWVATGKAPVKCLYNVVELFIFKFISDLRILPDDLAFQHIYEKAEGDPSEALQFYARNTRKKIYELFPKGPDGTTIINGTIFVNEEGEANLSQARLFQRSLQHLQDYEQKFGRFTKIDKQFKTRLYETFLKQEVAALGQYFTPRVLVQSVIRMAGIDRDDYQFAGKRICDPFCGVGGFLLETLNLNDSMRDAYTPDRNGHIDPGFVMHGFDKGFERDDERTIIMAKANMLIYLAELLFKNPSASPQFAATFNETFVLYKDNLGTFRHIVGNDECYDTILSNPPYVTSGTSIIKQEIADDETLRDFYTINGLGLESISLEWIVNSLRPGGQAFVVVPDGILNRVPGKKLRDYMLDQCYLDAIVSLPPRTFFSNFESTYVLALTKKHNRQAVQKHPVFAYLVTAIGERLTSVRREAIADNDLPEMERLFHLCRSLGEHVHRPTVAQFPRCKLIDVDDLRTDHWVIDRRWSNDEKIALGIETAIRPVTGEELADALSDLREAGERLAAARTELPGTLQYVDSTLGDEHLFTISIGKRVYRKDLVTPSDTTVPVYSSNVREPMGHMPETRVVTDYSHDSTSIHRSG